jgi:hypothetical protein
VALEERERAGEEPHRGDRWLVAEDLGVGQAGGVVNGDVHVVGTFKATCAHEARSGQRVGSAPRARSGIEHGEAHAFGLDGYVEDLVIEELGRGLVDKDRGARLVDRLVRRSWLIGERHLDGGVGTASPRG